MPKASKNESFYKRLNSLAGTNKQNRIIENKLGDLITFTRSNDGTAYGIVKENHNYYIKISRKQDENLSSADFTYINGLQNKTSYEYKSLAEAEKQKNFYIKSINEAFDPDKVLNKNSLSENKTPSLNVKENINDFIKKRIKSGKKNVSESKEIKFKNSLKPKDKVENKKTDLLNEVALSAIQHALGKLNETEDIVTSDSKIKDKDRVDNNKDHEKGQSAAMDYDNNQKEADKNNATGHEKLNKFNDSKSIIVNQADKVLKEEKDLSTADSEQNISDRVDNKEGKESAQAPINDENAKSEAEKNNASSQSYAIESDESEPFDDKPTEETDDIVAESKDLSTADSDLNPKDSVANKTGHEKPEATYNNYNQPKIGQKEKKGEKLKPIPSKKDIVAEEKDLSTTDSDLNPKDSLANDTKTHLPDSHGKDLSTEDSELHPNKSLANNTKTNLPNPVFEEEDQPFEEKPKESKDIVAEEKALSTADSKIDDSITNAVKSNVKFTDEKLESGTSYRADENAIAREIKEQDEVEQDLDAAADALGDLDVATDNEEETSDVAVDAEPSPEVDVTVDDTQQDDEVSDTTDDIAKGEDEDLETKEIQKLVGKIGEKIRNVDLTPDQTQGFVNSLLAAFKSDLGDVEIEERKEMADKILKAQTGSDESEINTAIDDKIEDLKSGEEDVTVQEDAPMEVNGEEIISDNEEKCEECGPFETYMESRGYSKDNLEECSHGEIADIVSGYANAYKGGLNDGDFENVAIYVSPEVEEELKEYGHDEYVEKLQPFIQSVKENNAGVTYGVVEPTIAIDPTNEDYGYEDKQENEIEFAPIAQSLGAGIVKPDSAKSKSVEVDLNSGTVNVQVNENEKKLRKYIRIKLEELSGKRKPSINENSNSENLKKLNKMIAEQWKEYGKAILKESKKEDNDDEKNEEKPSAGLSKEKKSEVVKKAKKSGDIGKKGKGFEKVVKAAKKDGAKDPEAVAASVMWKNIKR